MKMVCKNIKMMKKIKTIAMKNYSIIFLTMFSVLLLSSCSTSFDKKIANHIEIKCSDFSTPQSCSIDLAEVTDFEWDSMYVFASMTMPDEINEVIGFDCNCKHVRDNYTRVVFTKGNRIVYKSQYYGLGALVQFRSINKKDKYIQYSKNESVFYTLKKNNTLSEGYFYDLYPIDGERTPVYRK